MIAAALILVASAQEEPAPHPLDTFMRDVTEACLLPDLEKSDPHLYFAEHGWVRKGEKFEKQIGNAAYSVLVEWPASKKSAASCSFESDVVAAAEVYDWFKRRIGEPQDIVWSDKQVGGWRMNTNGHDAGVYVSRKRIAGASDGGMKLHILQN